MGMRGIIIIDKTFVAKTTPVCSAALQPQVTKSYYCFAFVCHKNVLYVRESIFFVEKTFRFQTVDYVL